MKHIELKILLFTSRLAKTQSFYSAVGIKWVGGHNARIDESFRPERPTDVMGLPFLVGDLGNVELNIYFRETPVVLQEPHTEIVVAFPETGDSARVVEKLKAAALF